MKMPFIENKARYLFIVIFLENDNFVYHFLNIRANIT